MRPERKLPSIDTFLMVSIVFLLLVFFLMFSLTNTHNSRPQLRLHAISQGEQLVDISSLKPRNVLKLYINKDNHLLINGEDIPVEQLREIAKEFIDNPDNEASKPEKKEISVSYFGPMLVTINHAIYLQYSKDATYGTYIAVRKELKSAYDDLRNELAKKKWQKHFVNLSKDERSAIRQIYPQRITESVFK
jgi:biopolymer transport protein ExbD